MCSATVICWLDHDVVCIQEAAKLPPEFILDLDFEDIELVEKGSARPLVPVINPCPQFTSCMRPWKGHSAKRLLLTCGCANAENWESEEANGSQAGKHACISLMRGIPHDGHSDEGLTACTCGRSWTRCMPLAQTCG